jgi:UDP-N-acetylmuramoyl-tripeptide--D-alanyl-D-alanine ligase
MIPMSIDRLAEACGGGILVRGKARRAPARVSTDTREAVRGTVFIALRGKRYDAHDFLDQAVEGGASVLVVSRVGDDLLRRAEERGVTVIKVRDTRRAMFHLAEAQVLAGGAEVVGVTGSTGKTLTKDFTASVLSRAGAVVAARGSYNNEVGVPLTIFRLTGRTRYLVLEMGSRGLGHLKRLCDFAHPRVGIITNIGPAHLRFFRSLENVARAKAELVQALPRGGWAVLNRDDRYFAYLRRESSAPVISFGVSSRADVRAEKLRVDDEGKAVFRLRLKGGERGEVRLPLPGRHNVYNALAAAAVGESMGLKLEEVVEGLEKAELTEWRMEMITRPDQITIINDAYNSNPVSMRSALMAMADLARDKRAIAVLGDMGELGPLSEEAHMEVGRLAVEYGTDILIAVGRKARKMAQAARERGLPKGSIFTADRVEKAAEILRAIIEPGDVVLIKGSRFLGLEKLVDLVA